MSKKKKTPKNSEEPELRCGLCGGELVPSGCGCKNEKCVNNVSLWPKPGTMYSPPREINKSV